MKNTPRPGHADFPASVKYGGFEDYRGSGRFSGRLTATMVMAGAIAQKSIILFIRSRGSSIHIRNWWDRIKIGHVRTSKTNTYLNEVHVPT